MRDNNLREQDQDDDASQQRLVTAASKRADVYLDFINTLHASRSKWSTAAIEFYIAQLLTGIRPYDWQTVLRWELGDKPGLWVFPFEGVGPHITYQRQTVMLDKYDTVTVSMIDRHIDRVQRCETEDEFQVFYDGCKRIVDAVASRTVPVAYKRPTLDAKSITLSKVHREAIAKAACHLLERGTQ